MLKLPSHRLLAWLLIALLPSATASADTIAIGSQTGAQIFFNNTLTRTYNFGITSSGAGLTFNTIDVNLKGQANTPNNVFPALITVYSGLGATGTALATGSIAPSSLTGLFAFRTVTLSSTLTLGDGGYSVRMTTDNVADYYLKNGKLTLTSTSGAVLSSNLWVEDSNADGTAGTTLTASGTVLAQWVTGTNAVRFGNFRVTPSGTITSSIPLTNNALATSNNRTQALAATGSTAGNLSLTGLPSPYLSQGQTQDFTVGLGMSPTGPTSGTATLTFNSVTGTSATTGTTAVGTGTVAVTGTGYDWANAKVAAAVLAFGNVRTGSAATAQNVAVGNQTVVNATYQDRLDVSGSTTNAKVTATGFSNLAASASGTTTSSVSLAANTATAGSLASTVSLSYTSNANGVAGLSTGSATIVGGTAPTITTTGGVYDWAQATYTGTTFAFGYIHRGGPAASGTAAIGNQTVTSGSFQDSLNASATTGNPLVSAAGFTGLAASTSGSTTNNLVVSIGTGTAGSLASTLALSLVSNANSVAGLSNGPATVVGSPGSITTTGTVFTGQSTWNTNGGGQWGTLASNFGSNWNWTAFDGSPGVDPSFTNTDTATFGNALTSGSATVTVTAATPSVKSVTFSNASASYALAGASGGSLALLNAGTTAAAIAVVAGTHAIALPVSLGSDTGIDVFAGSILSMSGVISGAKNVTKTGSGTTVFSGNNSYGGTTSVSAGTLLVHGNQASATGAISVAAGATLGGRGTAGGAVTVLGSGILSPGASVESLAVGATTFASGSSIFAYEVDSSVLVGSGSAADLLVANGNLSISSGSILEFTDLASSPTAFPQGTKFSLISYGNNSWDGGLFTYQGNELANLETFSTGLNQWEIRYDDPIGGSNFTGDQLVGSSVTITAVPEPASLAAVAIGCGALAIALRRRGRVARS
jgi:fibronectin-binding autotransporter adhesin